MKRQKSLNSKKWGLPSILVQGFKQWTKAMAKGRNPEMDAKVNNQFQLTQAAQTLSQYKLPQSTAWEPPFGWNEEDWTKYVNKPYKERLAIAIGLLISEAERIDYLEQNGQPVVPKMNVKPEKD